MIRDVHVVGLKELQGKLAFAGPRLAVSLLRSTQNKIAKEMAREMKSGVVRDTGNLAEAIEVKSARLRRRNLIEAGVRIAKGKGAKHDGWYWHLVEFGTATLAARPFVQPVYNKYRAQWRALFEEGFLKAFQKSMRKRGML